VLRHAVQLDDKPFRQRRLDMDQFCVRQSAACGSCAAPRFGAGMTVMPGNDMWFPGMNFSGSFSQASRDSLFHTTPERFNASE
jgi:hypothetical protein